MRRRRRVHAGATICHASLEVSHALHLPDADGVMVAGVSTLCLRAQMPSERCHITAGSHRRLQRDGAAGSSGEEEEGGGEKEALPCGLANAAGCSQTVSADTGEQHQDQKCPHAGQQQRHSLDTTETCGCSLIAAVAMWCFHSWRCQTCCPQLHAWVLDKHVTATHMACSVPQAMMAPADLLKSLLAMQKAGFELPDIAPNEIGLSIVTSWLHERFARLCSVGYRSEAPAADMGAHVVELLLLIINAGHTTCVALAVACWHSVDLHECYLFTDQSQMRSVQCRCWHAGAAGRRSGRCGRRRPACDPPRQRAGPQRAR
jgi:hypothetical protein